MTPQEQALLQQNAELTPDMGTFGSPSYASQQTPSTPPTTIAGGLAAMKSKIESQGPSGTDFEGIMKKYNVNNMIPSSLKSIMSQKSTPIAQPTTTMPSQPMFQQRGAQEAAGAISGALGDITQKMQTIRPAMTYERNPEMNQRLRQYLSSQGKPTTLPEEGSQEYFDVVRQMEVSPGQGGIFGEAGIEARKSAQEGQQKFGESFGEIDLGIRKVAQGDMSGFDQIFRKGLFQGTTGLANVVYSPVVGAMSQAPEPVKQELGTVVQGVTNVVDGTLSTVGIDPNGAWGQNIKAGMLAAMDVAPFLAQSKAVRAGVKGAGQAAGQAGAKVFEGTMIAGKQGAKLLNDAVGKVMSSVKKVGGKAVDATLEGASNLAFQTPAKFMRTAAKYGDDFIKVLDDIPATEIGIMDDVVQITKDVFSEKGAIGAMYEPLRKSGKTITYPKRWDAGVWDDLGIKLKGGVVVPKGGSLKNSKLTSSQLQQLNNRIGELLPKIGEKFTVDQHLKLKNKLDDIADWNSSVNRADEPVMAAARDLYSQVDKVGKKQVKELVKIDKDYGEVVTELKALRKEFMEKDAYGHLAIKKSIQPETITRLLSPTSRSKLRMLEEYIPRITDRLEVLEAAKNIAAAGEITTGKSIGRAVASLSTGFATANPLTGIAMFYLTDPVKAAKMFARYGKTINMSTETLDAARRAAQVAAKETVKKATTSAKTASAGVKTNLSSLKQKAGKATTKGAKGAADVGGAASGAGVPPEM